MLRRSGACCFGAVMAAARVAGCGGEAATLIRKVNLVEGSLSPPQGEPGSTRWTLPVHTLTFAVPAGVGDYLGTRIDYGDV